VQATTGPFHVPLASLSSSSSSPPARASWTTTSSRAPHSSLLDSSVQVGHSLQDGSSPRVAQPGRPVHHRPHPRPRPRRCALSPSRPSEPTSDPPVLTRYLPQATASASAKLSTRCEPLLRLDPLIAVSSSARSPRPPDTARRPSGPPRPHLMLTLEPLKPHKNLSTRACSLAPAPPGPA